jgi:hypothetical protein
VVSRAFDRATLASVVPATDVVALRRQLDALRLLLQADGVEDSSADVARLVRELDAIGIRLRGVADGESVADIAALVGELRNVAGRSLLHAHVEQAQARVQVAVRGRIAAWRETAPALDLTSQRAPD